MWKLHELYRTFSNAKMKIWKNFSFILMDFRSITQRFQEKFPFFLQRKFEWVWNIHWKFIWTFWREFTSKIQRKFIWIFGKKWTFGNLNIWKIHRKLIWTFQWKIHRKFISNEVKFHLMWLNKNANSKNLIRRNVISRRWTEALNQFHS